MKSVTLHNIEDQLYEAIKMNAKNNHRSLNQEIKEKLFRFYLKKEVPERRKSFKRFLGLWDNSDLIEFEKRISDFSKIDDCDWQ